MKDGLSGDWINDCISTYVLTSHHCSSSGVGASSSSHSMSTEAENGSAAVPLDVDCVAQSDMNCSAGCFPLAVSTDTYIYITSINLL